MSLKPFKGVWMKLVNHVIDYMTTVVTSHYTTIHAIICHIYHTIYCHIPILSQGVIKLPDDFHMSFKALSVKKARSKIAGKLYLPWGRGWPCTLCHYSYYCIMYPMTEYQLLSAVIYALYGIR